MSLRKTIWKTGGVSAAALLLVAPWALSQAPAPQGGAPGAQQTPGGANAGRGGRGGMVLAAPAFDYANNEGWIQLFNGRDLSGWDGDTRYWNVDDGAIHVESTCEEPTGTIYLVWQGGEPSDFMLKWESKGTEQVNGGIQFRSYMTADPNVHLKYYGRGGGGTLVSAATAGGGRGPGGSGGRGPGGPGGQGGGGRAGQPATCPSGQPRGTAPSRAEEAKWDMAGPQADFDAANQWPGSYYEQSSPRFIASAPGYVTLGLPGGQRVTLATLHDQATRDSWFKKNDYNQFLLVAKGNTIAQYMNGHLMSLFIDDDPDLFLPSGKIGIEVEATGGYWTKNIYLKRL
jgi:hypothetical protein